jgi:hypothetical protein
MRAQEFTLVVSAHAPTLAEAYMRVCPQVTDRHA